MEDPLAAVAALEGVGAAAGQARDAVDALLRHPLLRRHAGQLAARAATRQAAASAELAGADPRDATDPVVQGALRLAGEVPSLAVTWQHAPLQALARMHVLAARDLPGAAATLGRPRTDGEVGARLHQLARLATGPTRAPAVSVAAVVHGELAALRPFGTGDDLVARAAEQVVLVTRGVDPAAVSVPAAGHLALRAAYGPLLTAYRSGTPDGVAAWLRHCAEAVSAGAEEGLRLAAELAAELADSG